MGLIDIGDFYGFAHVELSGILLFKPHDEFEKRGFTGAIRTDNAHDAVWRKHEVEVVKEELVAIGFSHMLGFDNLIAESRTVGDENFEFFLAFFLVLVEEAVVGRKTRFTLGLSSLRSHSHPFKFALESLAALACLFLLLSHSLGLLVEPRRVVSFPGDTLAAVEFENPAGDMVEEVTVVSDGNHSAFVLLEVLLEPVDRLGIEVVGRLVEEEHIRLLEQEAA